MQCLFSASFKVTQQKTVGVSSSRGCRLTVIKERIVEARRLPAEAFYVWKMSSVRVKTRNGQNRKDIINMFLKAITVLVRSYVGVEVIAYWGFDS